MLFYVIIRSTVICPRCASAVRERSPMKKLYRPLLFSCSFITLFFLAVAGAQAQTDFARLFTPELGRLKPTVSFQATPYEKEEVKEQSSDFRMTHYNAFLLVPIAQDQKNEWSLLGTFRGQDIRTDAVLPDTGQKFPDGLWDVRFGPSYRHRFENGWLGGGLVTLGSASDRLFNSMDETEIQATGYVRIPSGERNAWIFLLTYSSNREFLNNVPLPGFAYWYEPSDRYRLLIGFPFASFHYKPAKDLSFEISYFPVRSIRSRVSYRLFQPLQIYAAFDWRNEGYFRAERTDRWDRLFYYEKRVYAGARWNALRRVFLDLSGGYAFDKFYFEGRSYSDRDHNRVDVPGGAFLALQAGLTL